MLNKRQTINPLLNEVEKLFSRKVEVSKSTNIDFEKRLELEKEKRLNIAAAEQTTFSKQEGLVIDSDDRGVDDEEREEDRVTEKEFILDETARIELEAEGSVEIRGKHIKAEGKIKFIVEERASVHNSEVTAEHEKETDYESVDRRFTSAATKNVNRTSDKAIVISAEARKRLLAEEKVRVLITEKKRLEEENALLKQRLTK